MLSIKDLYQEAATRTVRFRGKDITLREPSAAQSELVRAAFPRPVAPMAQDPNGPAGTEHILVPNEKDPGFRAKLMDHLATVGLVELAIAMDYRPADGTAPPDKPEPMTAWGGKVCAELRQLPERELAFLIRELNAFGDEQGQKEALGNSSAPPTPPG